MAETDGNGGLAVAQPFPGERPMEALPGDQLAHIRGLLTGEPAEEEEEKPNGEADTGHQAASTAEGASGDADPAPQGEELGGLHLGEGEDLDVAAMAAHLKVTEAELYEMQIPMGQDRGKVSFGQLKDAWRDQANLAERQEGMTAEANQMMGHRRTMQTTMNMLADKYGPAPLQDAVAAAEADGERYRGQERAALLARFPEWQDDRTYTTARGEMLELAREYQFSEADFTGVIDHRLVTLLRDFQQLKARVSRAKQAAADARQGTSRRGHRPGARVPAAKPAPASQAIKQQAIDTGDMGDMTRAAVAIIRENQ